MHCRRSVTWRLLAALALAGAAAGLVSGCSSRGEFPTVLDNVTPRNDTPLSPDQVTRATADLISARDHLTAEASASAADKAPRVAAANTNPARRPVKPAATLNSSRPTQTAGAGAQP